MRSAVYQPLGSWGALVPFTPAQVHQLNRAALDPGQAREPDLVKRLPSFPTGRHVLFPFYRPTIKSTDPSINGKPRPFMRAGSPIDQKSGVYLIWNGKKRTIYIGSSVGTSKQGNIRRTLARHWQSWNRQKTLSQYVTKFSGDGSRMPSPDFDKRTGGIVVPRNDIYVCIMLIDNYDKSIYGKSGNTALAPRIVEAWYYERLCSSLKCIGINQIARDRPDEQLEIVPF